MSRLIDSTDDFKAYKEAMKAAIKPSAIQKDSENPPDRGILTISVLFGFLMAWAALAIYGAIKLLEKIGWI